MEGSSKITKVSLSESGLKAKATGIASFHS